MTRMGTLRIKVVPLLILCAGMPAAAGAQGRVADIREHWIESSVVDEDYLIRVSLPNGYSDSSDSVRRRIRARAESHSASFATLWTGCRGQRISHR